MLSTQIAKKYGKAWEVQVLNTNDPIFNDIRKSDILWEFQNEKERAKEPRADFLNWEGLS